MTVRIPKYVTEDVSKKSWKGKTFVALGIVVLGFIGGYISSNIYVKHSLSSLQQQNEVLERTNHDLHGEIQQLKSDLALRETEIKVKSEAVVQLQSQYQDLLSEQDSLKSEIKFYQQLLNPQSENSGLRVFQVHLKSEQSSHILNLSLAQKIERGKTIQGQVEISFIGTENDKPAEFKPENNLIKYEFKYFQNVSLRFSLPEGFQVNELIVKLIPASNKSKAIEQSFPWKALQQQQDK